MTTFYVAENHIGEFQAELTKRVETALKAVGAQAVAHAVTNITEQGAVDTGLLRNSLTYALDGESPKTSTYHARFGSNRQKNGKRYGAGSKNAGAVKVGRYAGSAPPDGDGQRSVYIGTNVEYAPYVEMGTYKMRARPYLQPAIEQNGDEYRQIIKEILEK